MEGIDKNFSNDKITHKNDNEGGFDFSVLIQEKRPWDSFEKENIDKDFKRKIPTNEQIEKMDKSLNELGKLFKDSNFNWHLDGALNISLMKGEYIGNHKDVDISLKINEIDDLKNFEEYLFKNGYGLFLSKEADDSKNRIMRRVGYKNFKEIGIEHPLIAKINNNGEIIDDEVLNNIDVHLVEKNQIKAGNSEIILPDKWDKSYSIEYKGQIINLSHPGKVLYYKLHQIRNYDKTDIDRLIETGKLKGGDVDDIRKLYEKEFIANKELIYDILKNVSKKINSDMNAEQIFKILVGQPELEKSDEKMRDLLMLFAKEIFKTKDFSIEGMIKLVMDLFKVEDEIKNKTEELDMIKQKLENKLLGKT